MNLTTGIERVWMSQRMLGRRLGGVIAVVGLSLLAACGGDEEGGPGGRPGGPAGGPMAMGGAAERATPVAVQIMEPSSLQVTLRGSTNLRARSQVEVLPKQGGVVARILVEEGTPVRQGQPLAVLDAEEWALQARQTRARAQAAEDALERGIALQAQGLLADQEVESLRSNAEVASADAALAELRVQNATIVAPLAGVVTHRYIETGQLVGTNTAAFAVADVSRLEADVGIPEREAARVRVGQPVRISGEGMAGNVTGRVARIRPVVDPGSGTVQVTVEADPAQDSQLRAGQFVNLDIVTEVLEGRLALPRTALVLDGPVPRAFRVVDGRAEELTVTMGPSHGERVEILDGIEAGDTVVVVGQHNLRQGIPVSVMEIDGVLVSERQETPVLTREEASVERRAEQGPGVRPVADQRAPGRRPGGSGGSR